VAFLKEASSYGKLYVCVGTDDNVRLLKGVPPHFHQDERVYIVNAIQYVHKAFIAEGSGVLDFEPHLNEIKPDILIVNSDGDTIEKRQICRTNKIEYIVLERVPQNGLPVRYSSEIKKELRFPYRLCIAGGWMDQPWVSKIYPGSVVVAQIWPTMDFQDRSGMATSSRKVAIELWGDRLPEGDPIRNARLLFGAENPPDTQYVSGSQDHLGLLCPGINRLYYDGNYLPSRIESSVDHEICEWLSNVIHLIPASPRPKDYDPLREKDLRFEYVKALGEAGDNCWTSILNKDVAGLGKAMTQTFIMWRKILPDTVPDWIWRDMKKYASYAGAITAGSGGGYIMVASEKNIKGAIKVKVKYE